MIPMPAADPPRPTAARLRREALRDRLIDIAERRIAANGLAALRARDLAQEAGCALGAIYTAVGDLDELVLAVNARTFARLGEHVSAATPADLRPAGNAPVERLIVMAQAYHAFAAADRNLWRALFDIDRAPGTAAPDWYLAEMQRLFALIAAPLDDLRPDMPPEDRALLARALFSAVHGIVWLALDEASAGIPEAQVDRMIALILRNLAGGPQ